MEPPADAPIGERVTIEGIEGEFEPVSSTQAKKKKTWETVSKDLKTVDGGVATWQGKKLMTSKGPCKAATLADVPIA